MIIKNIQLPSILMSLMLLIGCQSNDGVDPSDCTVIEDPKWYVQPALVSVEIKDVGYITGVLIKDTSYIITSANLSLIHI